MTSSSNPVFHIVVVLVFSSVLLLETSGNIFERCLYEENLFNCSGIGALNAPNASQIPDDIEILDLSLNEISNITYLDYDALSDTLLTLNLSCNRIHILSKNAFRLLEALTVLDLSNNLITGDHLEENNFYDLNHLHTLNMSRNPLRHLKSNTFDFMQLGSIAYLDLSHSEISVIEPQSLDLPVLERLDLSWNKLQTFEEKFFKMLVNLQYLDLSHNHIVTLTEIPYLPALTTLVLNNNDIKNIQIRSGIEFYADKLEKLYLRNNEVVYFNDTSLPLEMDTLQVIDMTNNKLQCDCNMKWISADTYDFKDKNFTFRCDHPSRVRGKDLLTLAPGDLTCGPRLVVILLSVAILTIVVVVAGLVTFFCIRRCRRGRKQRKYNKDRGGNYTAVFTREEEDVRVTMADDKHLIENEQEFDV